MSRRQTDVHYLNTVVCHFRLEQWKHFSETQSTEKMARAVWTKLLSDDSIRRSSQTLSVIEGSAYLYGGELRPREPVDSAVYRIALDNSENT